MERDHEKQRPRVFRGPVNGVISLVILVAIVTLVAIVIKSASQAPGAEGLGVLLDWLAMLSLAVCVIGGVGAGARMAVQYRRGDAVENLGALGWVCVGAFVVGLIFSIVSGAAN